MSSVSEERARTRAQLSSMQAEIERRSQRQSAVDAECDCALEAAKTCGWAASSPYKQHLALVSYFQYIGIVVPVLPCVSMLWAMCQTETEGWIDPVGDATAKARAWAELDEAKATLLLAASSRSRSSGPQLNASRARGSSSDCAGRPRTRSMTQKKTRIKETRLGEKCRGDSHAEGGGACPRPTKTNTTPARRRAPAALGCHDPATPNAHGATPPSHRTSLALWRWILVRDVSFEGAAWFFFFVRR